MNPYVNLGNYYLSQDDFGKAKEEFEAAFCLDPYNENLIVNLGITNERIGNRKMAFMLYEFFMNNSFNVSSSLYRKSKEINEIADNTHRNSSFVH